MEYFVVKVYSSYLILKTTLSGALKVNKFRNILKIEPLPAHFRLRF